MYHQAAIQLVQGNAGGRFDGNVQGTQQPIPRGKIKVNGGHQAGDEEGEGDLPVLLKARQAAGQQRNGQKAQHQDQPAGPVGALGQHRPEMAEDHEDQQPDGQE